MKILVIGGFLGSGKTTTVLRLGRDFSNAGKKVAIIVNEIGEVGIDGDVISKYGLQTTELTSGCICCSLKVNMKTTISLLMKDYKPDILLIEPTGIAFPQIIRNEINLMDLKDVSIQPLVTLIDGSRFKQLMKEVKHFAMRQIIDAEVLGINKLDLVEKIRIPIIEASVQQLNPKARVVLLSATYEDEHWHEFVKLLFGEGAEEILSEKRDTELKTTIPGIQMVDRATGEPVEYDMNSINASGVTSYATEYNIGDVSTDNARSVVRNLIETIKAEVTKSSPEFVGHIKLFMESETDTVKANLTAFDKDVTYELIPLGNAHSRKLKILSAVSNIKRDRLISIVNDAVEDNLRAVNISFAHNSHAHQETS
ncbi:cobalamin biosynthesis protein P47K [Methanolobus chelungpuianus]|uniref:Cobalamin biosynthesis protein P47K n=2 Tax=Methanolobus chelungpuianus TaxID=502115 RepID=A0AAE3KWN5_9EURY|nr:cobalamin biosynthesis protein P47K [Methanolobus chelungpuianus]